MHVNGDLVTFLPKDRKPAGLRNVGEVPENSHTFYQRREELFMRDCVGEWWRIEGDFKHLSYEDISYDFERAADRSTGESKLPSCSPRRRPPSVVRVHRYRRRR